MDGDKKPFLAKEWNGYIELCKVGSGGVAHQKTKQC